MAIAGVGLVALRGCTGLLCEGIEYPPAGIRIATGGLGGVYAEYGQAYEQVLSEELPGLKVQLDYSNGSVDNLTRLAQGKADLTFISADTAYEISELEREAHATGRIRAIARVYDEYVQVVVRQDSPIRTLADLRGKRVSTGSPGSSVEITASRLLAIAKLNGPNAVHRVQLSVSESAFGLETGALDAFFWVGGLPTGAISALGNQVPIRLLPMDEYVEPLRAQYGAFYQLATVPEDTYVDLSDTKTVAVASYLLVSSSLNSELVKRLTSALFQHQAEIAAKVPSGRVLDLRSAINTAPVPLHPGAIRYYRSVKP